MISSKKEDGIREKSHGDGIGGDVNADDSKVRQRVFNETFSAFERFCKRA